MEVEILPIAFLLEECYENCDVAVPLMDVMWTLFAYYFVSSDVAKAVL